MNKVILIGRLTKDIELHKTQNDKSVCGFALGVDRDFKNANGEVETDFIPCVAWNSQADFLAKYCKKGYLIAVSGTIQVRKFDDEKGNTRFITEVICDSVKNLTPKEKSENNANNELKAKNESNVKVNGNPVEINDISEQDLPF